MSAYRMPKEPCTVARPTGIVMSFGLVSTSSGQSRLFQDLTKVKIATAATAGRVSGIMIVR